MKIFLVIENYCYDYEQHGSFVIAAFKEEQSAIKFAESREEGVSPASVTFDIEEHELE